MADREKYIVLLSPEAGGTEQPQQTFDSREEAVAFMESLPTVQGLRARLEKLEPPGAAAS